MALKKTSKICTRINFFEKSLRKVAEMVPGRLPKVVEKRLKNQWKINFIEILVFIFLTFPFSSPWGSGGTPLAAKTPKFNKITCKNTSVSINFCWFFLQNTLQQNETNKAINKNKSEHASYYGN